MTDTPSLALGIDPGPTRTGIAVVAVSEMGWPSITFGAHLDTGSSAIRTAVFDVLRRGGVVAIETLVGYAYEAKRVQQLIETARVEGRFGQMVLELVRAEEGLRGEPLLVSARDWRGAVCGSPTASDNQVRLAIESIMRALPKLSAEHRPHVYDAAGVALVGLAHARRTKWTTPAPVLYAVAALRDRERAGRGTKSQPKPKRAPTRAQSKRRSKARRGVSTIGAMS